MADKIYPEVGVLPPFQHAALKGCTILRVTGHTSNDYSAGDVLVLVPAGSDAGTYAALDMDAAQQYSLTPAPGAAATDVGAGQQMRTTCVLLEDIAARGSGLVCLRGLCLANANTTANIDKHDSLVIEGGTNLLHLDDTATGERVRVVALAYNTTQIAGGAGQTLIPVLFNGVEGFGLHTGV